MLAEPSEAGDVIEREVLSVSRRLPGRERRQAKAGAPKLSAAIPPHHGGDRSTLKPAGEQRKALTVGAYRDFERLEARTPPGTYPGE